MYNFEMHTPYDSYMRFPSKSTPRRSLFTLIYFGKSCLEHGPYYFSKMFRHPISVQYMSCADYAT